MFFSCRDEKKPTVQRDTSITSENSYSDLFLDSIVLENFIVSHPNKHKWKKDYFNFYLPRNYSYAWFSKNGMDEQALNLMNLVNNVITLYDDSSLYDEPSFTRYEKYKGGGRGNKKEILETELLLTAKFFEYSTKMYKGIDSDIAKLGWFIPRKKLDYSQLLESFLPGKKNNDFWSANNKAYASLQEFLTQYVRLSKQNFDSLPVPPKAYHIGDSAQQIYDIKERLHAFGDLKIFDSTGTFDSAVYNSVMQFERRMGLKEDGAIGASFIKELNVGMAKRLQQIMVNLERMRWIPAQEDSNHIFVNIPDYKMYIYDSSRLRFIMNVIVGKAATSTTVFSGQLKYIVFSPYWNVPHSIVKNEIAPGMRRSSNYLVRHNMEVVGKGKEGLPAIRQRPGGSNSLGRVKFMFPNSYDIYFHDTPNKGLFGNANRSFSHGCIRLSEPKKLAQYLLRNDTAWNEQKIDSVMHLTKEKPVTLKKPVPVTIAYFTAWVDEAGLLNFRRDIYKHDSVLAAKLFVK